MKDHWHEQVQRYVNGESSEEEAAALEAAMNEDAELRALYLDYMNLDVALGAVAEMTAIAGNGTDRMAAFPQPAARLSLHYWRWLAATAACAALAVLALHPRHRDALRERPDLVATISSTQNAIARLSVEPPASLPAWMSPTASMLDQPRIPQ
jgi:anti-sigma-K factor RskA